MQRHREAMRWDRPGDAVGPSTRSDKEVGQSSLRPAGPTALFLCCSSSPMPNIDSSSRLESEPFSRNKWYVIHGTGY